MSLCPSAVIPVFNKIHVPIVRPGWMFLCLALTDAISLSLAVAITIGWKQIVHGGVEIEPYLRLWPFLPAFLLLYGFAGLYAGIALSPPDELRRATICSAVGFVLLSTLTVSLRGAHSYIRPALLVAVALSVVLVPVLRSCARTLLGSKGWWGYPAVLFGPSEKSRALVEVLQRNSGLGLKPIAIVHDDDEGGVESITGIPTLRRADLLSVMDVRLGTYAVVMPEASAVLQREGAKFSHVLFIPDMLPFEANMWITPRAVGGLLGLEMQKKHLQPHQLAVKRLLDVSIAALAAVVLSPLLVAIAISISLGSDGPVLYSQWRIGHHGRRFRAFKFRTMRTNADQFLETYLSRHPELRAEWERDHKLKKDPRVTAIGRLLRKTSLDELPQLWNVLKGEMSLVGPRPIVDAEIVRYGDSFSVYTSVPGGVTGLWQVSGRNDTTYQERVSYDKYYVRNWSVWLDLHILCRTVTTVLLRKGAY